MALRFAPGAGKKREKIGKIGFPQLFPNFSLTFPQLFANFSPTFPFFSNSNDHPNCQMPKGSFSSSEGQAADSLLVLGSEV